MAQSFRIGAFGSALLLTAASPAFAAEEKERVEGAESGSFRTLTAKGEPTAGTPAVPVAASAATLPPPVSPIPANATLPSYRGSSVTLRNVVSALAFNKSAEPTYNPYYAMQLLFAPRYWLSEKLYLRGSFDVSTELTRADWTTDRFYIGDVAAGFGADGLFTEPLFGIVGSPELSVSLPASKGTRASTRLVTTSASLSLSKKLGPVTVGYSAGADKYWNRFTTGSAASQLASTCDLSSVNGCVPFLVQNGRRNASWALSNGLNASFKANTWLSVGANVGVSTAFLYGLPDIEGQSLEISGTSNVRYFMSTGLSASARTNDFLTVGAGLRSAYGQLRPDGSYRTPFMNRFTQVYLDLNLNIAGLVGRLRS